MNDHTASTLTFVDRLSSIVERLTAVADQMPANEAKETFADVEPSSQEALQIRSERLQLVEAWTKLEAEQRRLALEQTSATGRPTPVDRDAKPEPLTNSPNPLDCATQFRLMQRERDRQGN